MNNSWFLQFNDITCIFQFDGCCLKKNREKEFLEKKVITTCECARCQQLPFAKKSSENILKFEFSPFLNY
jgi:hypothetical protein